MSNDIEEELRAEFLFLLKTLMPGMQYRKLKFLGPHRYPAPGNTSFRVQAVLSFCGLHRED